MVCASHGQFELIKDNTVGVLFRWFRVIGCCGMILFLSVIVRDREQERDRERERERFCQTFTIYGELHKHSVTCHNLSD